MIFPRPTTLFLLSLVASSVFAVDYTASIADPLDLASGDAVVVGFFAGASQAVEVKYEIPVQATTDDSDAVSYEMEVGVFTNHDLATADPPADPTCDFSGADTAGASLGLTAGVLEDLDPAIAGIQAVNITIATQAIDGSVTTVFDTSTNKLFFCTRLLVNQRYESPAGSGTIATSLVNRVDSAVSITFDTTVDFVEGNSASITTDSAGALGVSSNNAATIALASTITVTVVGSATVTAGSPINLKMMSDTYDILQLEKVQIAGASGSSILETIVDGAVIAEDWGRLFSPTLNPLNKKELDMVVSLPFSMFETAETLTLSGEVTLSLTRRRSRLLRELQGEAPVVEEDAAFEVKFETVPSTNAGGDSTSSTWKIVSASGAFAAMAGVVLVV